MSYLYGAPASAYPPPLGAAASEGYGAPPPASAYPRSPYAAPASAPPPHSSYAGSAAAAPRSPYVAPANAYPHSPYAGGQVLAPQAPGGYPGQPSPMAGQTYLPQTGYGANPTPQAGYGASPAAQTAQPFSGNVTAGAVTYTTTTDALGRVTYHHFRAEPSQYRSPQGVTYSGIQWVPTETSTVPPVGVPAAGPDIIASFRGQIPTVPDANAQAAAAAAASPTFSQQYRGEELKTSKEWEREEKRRRKEEKAAAKRNATWEAERLAREEAEEREIRRARERDADLDSRASRMRRPSYGGGLGSGVGPGAYELERSEREERELERRMGDLNVGGGRGGYVSDYGAPPNGVRSRRQSMSAPAAAALRDMYEDPAGYERERDDYGGYRERDAPRRSSIYGAPERSNRDIYAGPERSRDIYGASERSRPGSMYGAPERERASRPSSMYAAPERSPYRRDASPLPGGLGPGGDVYPPGHILAGQPMSGGGGGYAPSRSHSPSGIPGTAPYSSGGGLGVGFGAGSAGGGYGGASPRIGGSGFGGASPRVGAGGFGGVSPRMGGNMGLSPRVGASAIPGLSPRMGGGAQLAGGGGYGMPPQEQQLLSAPEAFSRPLNRAQTFTPFKELRVQDLDDFHHDVIRPMPAVLGTHDVMAEDWLRLMNDIALAWKGRLPLPTDGPSKRSDLVIDLLDLWNTAFFLPRSVELVLYKGRNARSGRGAGLPETRLAPEQLFEPGEFSDSESGSEDESEEEYGAGYGRRGQGHARAHSQKRAHGRAARRKQRFEAKVEREMELNKRYSLWLWYIPPRDY